MTAGLIGAGISVLLAVFGWWFKWRLNKAREDRLRREIAEKAAEGLREGLKSQYEADAAHEKKVVEIMGGVSDARAGELLSTKPRPPKIPRLRRS